MFNFIVAGALVLFITRDIEPVVAEVYIIFLPAGLVLEFAMILVPLL